MTVIVECQKRQDGTKPKALRREGLIPASLYGHQGSESLSLTIPAKVAEKLLKEASVNNTLVDLNIPDLSWKGKTILREVQTHPWKPSVYHISFFAVSAGSSLDLVVPLHLVGEPYGVTQEGGVLDVMMTELPIQCTPANIPDSIEIDITHLKLGDSLQVHQLPLSEGVTAHVEGERTVLAILQSRNTEKSTGTGEETEQENSVAV
jgi:large subunit ribosomal protein L25